MTSAGSFSGWASLSTPPLPVGCSQVESRDPTVAPVGGREQHHRVGQVLDNLIKSFLKPLHVPPASLARMDVGTAVRLLDGAVGNHQLAGCGDNAAQRRAPERSVT